MVREYTLYYFYHFKVIEVCFREEQTNEIENKKNNSWFIEKINKIDKPLSKLTKKKGEKLKLLESEMKENITTLQKYRDLQSNTMDNCMPIEQLR